MCPEHTCTGCKTSYLRKRAQGNENQDSVVQMSKNSRVGIKPSHDRWRAMYARHPSFFSAGKFIAFTRGELARRPEGVLPKAGRQSRILASQCSVAELTRR